MFIHTRTAQDQTRQTLSIDGWGALQVSPVSEELMALDAY